VLHSDTLGSMHMETHSHRIQLHIYNVSENKTPTQSFYDNFGKYGQILIIISPLYSAMNSRRSFYKICHHTSNLLLHFLAKFQCSAEQPFTIVIQFKVCKAFIFSKYDLDDMSMPIHLQCYSMCSKYLPSARRYASSHVAACQWMHQ